MPRIATNATIRPAITPSSALAARGAIVALLVKVLRPLVLIMLRHGITVYEFAEISRWLFARVAMDKQRFAVRERKVWSMTKSRAAVLTGLTRREVDRLLIMREPAVEETRTVFHRCVRVLSAWMNEPGYQDANGRPCDLAVKGPHGSLEWLVRHYCRDIPVRAMLDELLDRDCVVQPSRERVRFVHADPGGPEIAAEQIDRMTDYAGHFMSLVESSLCNSTHPPHFVEISTGPVAPEHRDHIQLRITQVMESFALEISRELSGYPKPLMPDDNTRVVLGVYNGFV